MLRAYGFVAGYERQYVAVESILCYLISQMKNGFTRHSKQKIPVDNNIRLTQEKRLRDVEVGVWCAVCMTSVIGHIRLLDITNSKRYIRKILAPFYENLTDTYRHDGFFRQYSATVHTSCQSMAVLQNVWQQNYYLLFMACSFSRSDLM